MKVEGLIDDLTGYLEDKAELYKLEFKEELAYILSKFLVLALMSFVFLVFFVFATITLGNYLNQLLHSTFLGHLIITVFYLITFIIIYIYKDSESFRGAIEDSLYRLMKSKKSESDE